MKGKIMKLLGFFSILIGLIIFLYPLIFLDSFTEEKIKERNVKCYDKYSNEIVGQTCIEKYLEGSGIVSLCVIMSALFIAVGLLFFVSAVNSEQEGEQK